MKELIVITGSVILACLIFDMIAGNEESLKSAADAQMERMQLFYQE